MHGVHTLSQIRFPNYSLTTAYNSRCSKKFLFFHLAISNQHLQLSILHLFIMYMKYMINKKYWTLLYAKDRLAW